MFISIVQQLLEVKAKYITKNSTDSINEDQNSSYPELIMAVREMFNTSMEKICKSAMIFCKDYMEEEMGEENVNTGHMGLLLEEILQCCDDYFLFFVKSVMTDSSACDSLFKAVLKHLKSSVSSFNKIHPFLLLIIFSNYPKSNCFMLCKFFTICKVIFSMNFNYSYSIPYLENLKRFLNFSMLEVYHNTDVNLTHYYFRKEAAKFYADIIAKYYPKEQNNVVSYLKRIIMNKDSKFCSCYGALCAIRAMGSLVTTEVIPAIFQSLIQKLNSVKRFAKKSAVPYKVKEFREDNYFESAGPNESKLISEKPALFLWENESALSYESGLHSPCKDQSECNSEAGSPCKNQSENYTENGSTFPCENESEEISEIGYPLLWEPSFDNGSQSPCENQSEHSFENGSPFLLEHNSKDLSPFRWDSESERHSEKGSPLPWEDQSEIISQNGSPVPCENQSECNSENGSLCEDEWERNSENGSPCEDQWEYNFVDESAPESLSELNPENESQSAEDWRLCEEEWERNLENGSPCGDQLECNSVNEFPLESQLEHNSVNEFPLESQLEHNSENGSPCKDQLECNSENEFLCENQLEWDNSDNGYLSKNQSLPAHPPEIQSGLVSENQIMSETPSCSSQGLYSHSNTSQKRKRADSNEDLDCITSNSNFEDMECSDTDALTHQDMLKPEINVVEGLYSSMPCPTNPKETTKQHSNKEQSHAMSESVVTVYKYEPQSCNVTQNKGESSKKRFDTILPSENMYASLIRKELLEACSQITNDYIKNQFTFLNESYPLYVTSESVSSNIVKQFLDYFGQDIMDLIPLQYAYETLSPGCDIFMKRLIINLKFSEKLRLSFK